MSKQQNIRSLLVSFNQGPTVSSQNEQTEIQLIDQFIKEHANKYQLFNQLLQESHSEVNLSQNQSEYQNDEHEQNQLYTNLVNALLKNRIEIKLQNEIILPQNVPLNQKQIETKKQSMSHQLRVFQCLRILSRDEELCNIIVYFQEQSIEKLIVKLIELAQICINGTNHLQNNFMNQTNFQLQNTGKFSSPGRITQIGTGPEGSGPILNDEEIVCDILTEIISTLLKIFTRLQKKCERIQKNINQNSSEKEIEEGKAILQQSQNYLEKFYENIEFLQNTQLLLGVKFHNVLLRIVLELIICLIEAKPPLVEQFRNLFTIDILLKIFEDYQDIDLKISALDTITQLCKCDQLINSFEILYLIRKLGGPQKLLNYLQLCDKQAIQMEILICLYVLSSEDQDILIELKELNITQILLELLQRNLENPIMVCQILSIFTNLCLNDQINISIRQQGAHLIGKILMDNCPPLIKERQLRVQQISNHNQQDALLINKYSDDQIQDLKIKHEIQSHCLRVLRFLFSIEKNRKSFKLVFPPEIFGAFIDIGNYNKNFQSYITLLKKLNKKLPLKSLEQIQMNFEQMCQYSNGQQNKKKFIGGFQVIDLIGKGAYGSVYLVQKGDIQYAMKELPIANFDITPDQLQNMQKEHDVLAQSTDELLVEEICKEVSILKDMDHPNITRYFTSFPNGQNIYIVMELLDGVSLADFIISQSEKKHRVKEEVIWNILTQLCGALKYLHDIKRIVHRDLAPSNILIDSDFNIKLADFGLAKRFGTQSVSVMKSFVGTILYSCPEIVQSQTYTNKADIWSLGCIIYELITLSQPFSGNNPLQIAKKIVDGEFEPIKDDGFYSPMLVQIVNICMSADQNKRPNITELCQMMVDIVMQQLDFLRIKDQVNTQDIRHLKDKLKYYEGPTSTGFKGFSSAEAALMHNQNNQNIMSNTQNTVNTVNGQINYKI